MNPKMEELYSFKRHRRLRSSESMRSLVRETHIQAADFIYPIFILEGTNTKNEVPSMPGIYQITLDLLEEELSDIRSEEHTSELQSRFELVCRLLLEKKKIKKLLLRY